MSVAVPSEAHRKADPIEMKSGVTQLRTVHMNHVKRTPTPYSAALSALGGFFAQKSRCSTG